MLFFEAMFMTPRLERRWWVHDICQSRWIEGEFKTLWPRLLADEEKFFDYLRMTEEHFYFLEKRITPIIEREDTSYREAVSVRERLFVTIR